MRLILSAAVGTGCGAFMSSRTDTPDACAFGFVVFIICAVVLYGIMGVDDDFLDW